VAADADYGRPITENATGDPRSQNPLYIYNHGFHNSIRAAITAGMLYDPTRAQIARAFVGRCDSGDINAWAKVRNPPARPSKASSRNCPRCWMPWPSISAAASTSCRGATARTRAHF
jgi:hypothetical protein